MVGTPHTYAEWVNVLETLKAKTNDDEVLAAMKQGTIEWQSGVAERFSKKLADAVNSRMNAASDKFQRDLDRSNGEERVIVQSLLALRKELNFLLQVVDFPALPDKYRLQYRKLVLEQADQAQSSLEESAKRDRSGKLSSIVRNHRVNKFEKEVSA